MKNQDDIGNHNVNIICKENDDDVDCNKTQNMVKNEVIEEHNDENKKVKVDLNRDNVAEWNPEDVVTNEEMNIIPVIVLSRCSRISTSKGSSGTTKDKLVRQGSKSIISSCYYI